jgi:hypothetical protein
MSILNISAPSWIPLSLTAQGLPPPDISGVGLRTYAEGIGSSSQPIHGIKRALKGAPFLFHECARVDSNHPRRP